MDSFAIILTLSIIFQLFLQINKIKSKVYYIVDLMISLNIHYHCRHNPLGIEEEKPTDGDLHATNANEKVLVY